jgi:hypothetical protein
MNVNVRKEEYTVLGDFILTSYSRDLVTISTRFPKLGTAFKDEFVAKLNFVKALESGLVLKENQKEATSSLYQEAGELNGELNFVSSYFKDAGLNTALVTDLKNDLFNHNIEGALLKIEGLKQYIVAHLVALVEEGMEEHFPDKLTDHKVSLTAKNNAQNALINDHKELINANVAHYDALYSFIASIAEKGKLVFKGTVYQDEYTISKVMKRMRAPGRKDDNSSAPRS